MSPEQAAGHRATPASDVFALGAMLYELLTGEPAFSGTSIPELLSRVQRVEPAMYADAVPEPFSEVLRSALAALAARGR